MKLILVRLDISYSISNLTDHVFLLSKRKTEKKFTIRYGGCVVPALMKKAKNVSQSKSHKCTIKFHQLQCFYHHCSKSKQIWTQLTYAGDVLTNVTHSWISASVSYARFCHMTIISDFYCITINTLEYCLQIICFWLFVVWKQEGRRKFYVVYAIAFIAGYLQSCTRI